MKQGLIGRVWIVYKLTLMKCDFTCTICKNICKRSVQSFIFFQLFGFRLLEFGFRIVNHLNLSATLI